MAELGKRGLKGPSKLTDELVARVHELYARDMSQRAIAAEVGVDSATVRVALGRRKGGAGWEARKTTTAQGAASAAAGTDIAPMATGHTGEAAATGGTDDEGESEGGEGVA